MVKWGDRKCFLLRQTLLRDPLKPDCTVAPAKMAKDVLRAQAHFSTTQQLFSSSFNRKSKLKVFRYMYIFFKKIFSVGGTQGDSCQNGKICLQVQPR